MPVCSCQLVDANLQCRTNPQEGPRRYSADDANISDEGDSFDDFTWDVAANSNAPHSSNNRSIAKTHKNQRGARRGHARKN